MALLKVVRSLWMSFPVNRRTLCFLLLQSGMLRGKYPHYPGTCARNSFGHPPRPAQQNPTCEWIFSLLLYTLGGESLSLLITNTEEILPDSI